MTSETGAVVVPLRDKPLKHLNGIAKRPKLDIEFKDLIYSARDSSAKQGWRQILNSISGQFRCGELTAIMGPSGAGKSTLLNILAGYVTAGVQGTISINDRPRDLKLFNKLSSYIMQEDLLQPRLTVREAMIYAASLKLGSHIAYEDKLSVVEEVIDLLGLTKCIDTFSEYLSGGQRKRLSVALELVNNPPVIFLDEPTTGLDNFAMKQCIDLLKKISELDRTVVCTIHQPSASLFQYFDQVYIVADGYCVYNGCPNQLVSFFSLAGYTCPSNNTPADYMIELVHSNSSVINDFKTAIRNGKVNRRTSLDDEKKLEAFIDKEIYPEISVIIQNSDIDFPASFWVQFCLLFSRMFLQMRRNRIGLYIQFFHHLSAGLIVGAIFAGIGNNAAQTLATFKYCVCCNVFFLYTHTMLPVLLFPFEVQLMKREYFNRWYGLKAYYLAMTITTFPLLVILGIMFSALVYFLTDQPNESHRFLGFCLISLSMALTSQGLGYLIGSLFNITNGSVVGPSVLAPLLAIGVYGMGYKAAAIAPFYQYLMKLTFVRNGIVGLLNTLFYNRGALHCPDEEIYCHYARPDNLMLDMSMPVMDYKYDLCYILIFMLVFRISGYISLKCKLNTELSSRIVYYFSKIIKYKNVR